MSALNIYRDKQINAIVNAIEKDQTKKESLYNLLYLVYEKGLFDKVKSKSGGKITMETVKEINQIMPNKFIQSDDMKDTLKIIEELLINFRKSEAVISKKLFLDEMTKILKVVYFQGMINSINVKNISSEDFVTEQLKLYQQNV